MPGMSVAIVKDGKVLFAKGYGVRALTKPDKADADTLFGIGSNTKAFTVAALSMLVDEGKLRWDDKVTDLLPGFRLYDPYVTRELTVRDLLSHRSGLGLGSGDLMLFPPSDFTRAEIIHNLRYLQPASSFRSKYAYDNLLYIVAGELIPKITGISWEQFVQTKILDRLGTGCAATLTLTGANHNVAAPHVVIDGKLTEVAPDPSTAYDPAGSIQCSANGMAAWANLQLAGGQLPDGSTLFSTARHKEMWTPQTIVPVSTSATNPQTRFRNYGLGWFIEDYDGALRVTHTGGLIGMVSYVSLLPEQHVGVVVLTNQQSGAAMSAMMQTLLDALPPPAAQRLGRGPERARGRADQASRGGEWPVTCPRLRSRRPAARRFLPLDSLRRRLSRPLARRCHGQEGGRQAASGVQSHHRHAGRPAGDEGQPLRGALGQPEPYG